MNVRLSGWKSTPVKNQHKFMVKDVWLPEETLDLIREYRVFY